MSFKFKILGSSSSGNAALLCTSEAKILIDAGFSAKKLNEMLIATGESIENIDAIFLTHEHSDHTHALTGLGKYHHLEIFANQDTAKSIRPRLRKPLKWNIFETGRAFSFKDLHIDSFSLPHDAYDPVGYVFSKTASSCGTHPSGSLAWVTDLGHAPQWLQQKIKGVDILVIESNYDNRLLEEDTKRPWSVKQRIRGRHGHLSNEDTYRLITSIENPRWKHVFLAHLSQHCNALHIVEEIFRPLQTDQSTFSINIVDPINYTAPIIELI